ncbi:hypothetical protein G7Y89_g2511 [Cudoniella acicularis]|uniref:Adenosine deaminase domain-containing protein n=1 Tax=Cudoniella acicularis TaxID=354080 RepID=A0A8H4RTB8_9HELO|nr:hypothetical protein G7Y89_g2511 [Cudoniella acicularis]
MTSLKSPLSSLTELLQSKGTMSNPTPKQNEIGLQDGVPDSSHHLVHDFVQAHHDFRVGLSPTARRACAIVSKIRTQEFESIWSATADPSLNPTELFPGMMFNIAKNHMKTTKLWRIVQKMPKGALLHCHLGAMVDLEWVFNEALKTPGMCVSSSVPLVDEVARASAEVEYCFSKSGVEKGASIWGKKYVAKTWIPITVAADSYPDGGRKVFVAWMKDRCSITQAESLQHHLGVDDVWRKLNSAFSILVGIIYYEPVMRQFLRQFFKTLLEDGVRWVEIRAAPFTKFNLEGEEEPISEPGPFLKVVQEEIERFKNSEEGKSFLGARMIWVSIRFWNDKRLIEDMEHCIRLKSLYPDLISGYDLVGHEDTGRTLSSMAPSILYFRSQCASKKSHYPLLLPRRRMCRFRELNRSQSLRRHPLQNPSNRPRLFSLQTPHSNRDGKGERDLGRELSDKQ